MHDPVDIRRRIDRLVARVDRRDDYGQLLASGQVIYRLEDVYDVEAWRAEIKRQARADKIKVRTGFNDGIVWALRFPADRPGGQPEVRRCRHRRVSSNSIVPDAESSDCAKGRLAPM